MHSIAEAGIGGQGEPDWLETDLYTAAAYGDLENLRLWVEEKGCSAIQPDAGGYYALQWSALNNRAEAAQYLLEHGADVHAADNNAQTALHWAAVQGSLEVAELLLRHGACLEIADDRGYRTTHVAAQYGQTHFLYVLVTKWNAEIDPLDNEKCSPLHWAAYKGFAGTIRLLLFMDASLDRKDTFCCTPLHSAAIRGNLQACMVLVQAGTMENLMTTEITGCTAAQLALDMGYRSVALFLDNAGKDYENRRDSNGFLGKIAKLGLIPVVWLAVISLVIMFTNSVVASSSMVKITAGLGFLALITVFLAIGGLFFLHRCSNKDPGSIPRASSDLSDLKDPLLKKDLYDVASKEDSWDHLCHTCKIVRPLRSKHCASCNRCVEQYDHHCPWISNCVGKMNKWDFFILLCMEVGAMIIGAIVTFHRLYTDENAPSGTGARIRHVAAHHPGALGFVLADVCLLLCVGTLAGMQATQIARNITRNEMINFHRYSYLTGPDGRFRNPYDQGVIRNCSDFLLNGYSSDCEATWRPQQKSGSVIQLRERIHNHRTASGL